LNRPTGGSGVWCFFACDFDMHERYIYMHLSHASCFTPAAAVR